MRLHLLWGFFAGAEVQIYVCNKERYGYLNVPAKPHQTVEDDRINFVHLYLEALSEWDSSVFGILW